MILVADEPPDFVIDGFTVRNGNGGIGGAIFVHHRCEATIINCVITASTSSSGGAVLCLGVSPGVLQPALRFPGWRLTLCVVGWIIIEEHIAIA